MTSSSVVLIFDQPWVSYLIDGKAPLAAYSHDQSLFQFGHESLRKGFTVYIDSSRETEKAGTRLRVRQFYPILQIETVTQSSKAEVKPDLVVCVYPQSLSLRKLYPEAKIIGIVPAMNFLEHPEKPSAGWIYGFFESARSQIDYYITPNERMAEILRCLLRFCAQVDMRDRILIAPPGIVPEQRRDIPPLATVRAEMGLGPHEVAFINSGGAWSWTDYATFLSAFCNVVRSGQTNIKFFMMGFKQPENPDHKESVDRVLSIIEDNADLVGLNLLPFKDWYEAADKAYRFTCAADIGVNVSKDTVENWQSYRLRFLEYMKAGIPVVHTTGDYLSSHGAADAVYPVKAGDIASYEAAIRIAATDAALRAQKAAAMKKCAQTFDSRQAYGQVIARLVTLPKRDFTDPKEVFEPSLLARPEQHMALWQTPAREGVMEKIDGEDYEVGGVPTEKMWTHKEGWYDGNGAAMHSIPELSSDEPQMCFGFDFALLDDLTSNWAEILQLGATPDQSRMIAYAVYTAPKVFYLVFRIFDISGRSIKLKTAAFHVRRVLRFTLRMMPAEGRVQLWLDDQLFENWNLEPWSWIAINSLWLGSRRLPAEFGEVWIGH